MNNLSERKGYNGNPLLKRSRASINWTPDLLAEYTKCKYDPIYFAEKYIHIVNVDKGFIPIKLYDYQKEIINKLNNGRRVTVVTSRQAGKCVEKSTIINVRNKNTNEIVSLTIEELYELESKRQK